VNSKVNELLLALAISATLILTPLLEFRYFAVPVALLLGKRGSAGLWNSAISALLVVVFVFFPFIDRQNGVKNRFML